MSEAAEQLQQLKETPQNIQTLLYYYTAVQQSLVYHLRQYQIQYCNTYNRRVTSIEEVSILNFTVIFQLLEHMIRPPKPPLKYKGGELQCASANPTKVNKPNPITGLLISRFSSASLENEKPNQPALKKTEDSETNLQDKFVTVFISPRIEDRDQTLMASNRNSRGVKLGGFKIRYLSSQVRKSSRGLAEVNLTHFDRNTLNLNEGDKMDKNYKIKDQLCLHPYEKDLKLVTTRTGITKLPACELPPSRTCFIIPDSLLEQPVNQVISQEMLTQLSVILAAKQVGLVLQASSRTNISWVKQVETLAWSAIWTNERQVSSSLVLSLEKLRDHFTNYIVIVDEAGFGSTTYYGGIGARYAYLQVSCIQDVMKLASGYSKLDQFNSPAQFSYLDTSKVLSVTAQMMENRQIIEKISIAKLKMQSQQVRVRSISLKEGARDQNEAQNKFTEDYRNKLMQLAKLLSSEQPKHTANLLNNRCTSNWNRYLTIVVDPGVAALMQCMVPTSTAYQLANDLTRNNQMNWQQIAQFTEKAKLS